VGWIPSNRARFVELPRRRSLRQRRAKVILLTRKKISNRVSAKLNKADQFACLGHSYPTAGYATPAGPPCGDNSRCIHLLVCYIQEMGINVLPEIQTTKLTKRDQSKAGRRWIGPGSRTWTLEIEPHTAHVVRPDPASASSPAPADFGSPNDLLGLYTCSGGESGAKGSRLAPLDRPCGEGEWGWLASMRGMRCKLRLAVG
jgi:hypothetical protein